jgi:hypothetical protein
VYDIMSRRNMIDEPPEILRGRTLDVTYSSMIAKTQRVNEGQNIGRTMQAVAPFVTADQSVLDNFDGDKAVRALAKIYGFPQEILRDAREIEELRAARAEAQQAAVQAETERANLETVGKAAPGVAKLEEASRPTTI